MSTQMPDGAKGSLAGVKVLDLTAVVVVGPVCTLTLAEQGADVIKLEPLDRGRDAGPWPAHHLLHCRN